jgi:hypothetical protein
MVFLPATFQQRTHGPGTPYRSGLFQLFQLLAGERVDGFHTRLIRLLLDGERMSVGVFA